MLFLGALLLAAAPVAAPPPEPVRVGVSVQARATVEILRAEPVTAEPRAGGVERRVKPTAQGLLVEFS
jgi:hypothetical protein